MKKAFTIGLATALTTLSVALPAAAEDDPAAESLGGWRAPVCQTVTGDGSVTYTRNDGRTIAPTSEALQPVVYTTGLVALDQANEMLAMSNNRLLSSTDSGCTWTLVGKVSGWYVELAAAGGDRAYAWDRDGNLSLVTPREITPLTSPSNEVRGIGVDRGQGDHLRVAGDGGQLYDSGDGGRTWQPVGTPAFPPSETLTIYTAVFDPHDLDHVVMGASDTGVRVTFDGGRTWTTAGGLSKTGDKVNVFSAAISPSAPNVVWAMGLDLSESGSGVPSDGRHIYRSDDGGRTFTPVVDQGNGVTLQNGPLLAPHPTDPGVLYFDFGTGWSSLGTDIYRYDSRRDRVTINHNSYDRVTSISFNPANPKVMYLGVAEEV
ncbi:dispase autolysis-inducing protein [Nonomuraea phyllanthi]|uniref:WD40/YVTN/BNR-like repeat-containing protein n=1 Tax=Nonomuraea phyllanthi TaxID=2219224 RepID=UPI001293EEA1|nr:dispase autolysis-inducing protein [Nonomuraea phyllanthi]QFY13533.1 dispase autolysis-inducing protein [Nonomuraea phyllanthi]